MADVNIGASTPSTIPPRTAPPSAVPPPENSVGALAQLVRSGSPLEQGAALRALDAQTGDRALSEALVAQSASAGEQCRVEVRYTPITLGGFRVPGANHAFIVTTDGDSQNYVRGGPSARNDGVNSGSSNSGTSGSGGSQSSNGPGNAGIYGIVATEYGAYREGTVDWTTTPSGQQDVARVAGNCDAIEARMIRAADAIEATQTTYGPLAHNSNTTARVVLEEAGFPGVQPVVGAPSWNLSFPLAR